MKRYITIALCALTVFGLGSCNKVHEEDFDNAGRSVTFQAQLGNDTRTGLALKFVPDWRQTTLSDVHIWEVAGSERYEGEDVKMRIPGEAEGNYEIALFKADFSNMTIIVNPPSNAPTRAGETYSYTSIVAPKDANGKFTVPSTQKPDTETLIDPHADFIVGKSPAAFDQSQAGKEVNLIFTRPVAISRLSIMNVEDPTIKQVKIYSSDKLTGSASYENVDFANATVSFDNSGANVITLDYGSGVAMPAEGIFNAYFISLVGTKRITKIEVVTNAQTLTKEFEGGKALTFKVPDFKSIAVNMGDSVTPGPGEDQPQNIRFVRGTTTVTTDSYDLYSTAAYVSPTVTGQAQGATLTYESSDPAVATVSTQGVVTPVGPGETTISVDASKVEGYQAGHAEFTLTVTDSTPEPVDQPLKFMKGGQEITSDTYDFYNGGTYVSPTLSGAVDGATVTWAITCTPAGCATIDTDGKVTPVAVGAVVVTATASAVAPLYKQTSKSYDLEIKDTTPAVGPTVTINLEAATELVAGEKYVLVSNGFALVRDGDDAAAAAFDATALTVAVPTDLQETLEWTLEKKSGSITRGNEYAFTQGAYFFGIAMNTSQQTYTYTVEVNNGRNVATNVTIQDHNISIANGLIYYAGNSSNYYIFYNTTDKKWDNEKVSNSANPAATSKTAIYKLKDMRAEQNPTFTADEAEYDLYEKVWTKAVPTLRDAKGTVTYESSDTDVATVNATSGTVSIMTTARKGDTAVITAKAAGNDEFKPGSASYTISIVNNNPNVAKYVKVTSAAGLVPGAKYLLVFEGLAGDTDGDGDPKVFDPVLNSEGTQFAKATTSALPVTIASGVIESSDFDDCQFTLETGYYLKSDKANKYIYPGTTGSSWNSSSVMLAENTASHTLTIAFSDGIAEIANGGRYLVWSISNHYFSCNSDVSGQYSTGICLYKLDDGTTPEPPTPVAQTLSFNPTSVSGKVGESVTKPTLSGAMTTVTYTSSDATVAAVDTNNGDLTLNGEGSATITATAAAGTVGGVTYAEGTATYTVSVTAADTPPTGGKTYTQIEGDANLVTGTYVIADKTNAYLLNASDPNSGGYSTIGTTTGVTRSGSTITLDSSIAEAHEFVITRTDNTLTIKKVGGDHAGQYLFASASVTNSYMGFQSSAKNFTLNPQENTNLIYFYTDKSSSSPTEYLYKKAADNYFKLGQSGAPGGGDAGVLLYKLNDGGTTPVTPDPPTPQQDPTYTRINGASELVTGTYVVVEKTDTYVYNASGSNHGGYGTIGTTSGISKSGTTITLSNDIASSYEFTFTRTGDNLTIQPVAGDNAGKYMYATNSVSNTYIDFQTAVNNFTVNPQSGDLVYFRTTKGTSENEYLYKKAADSFFKLGGSGAPGNGDAGIYLYKKN